MLTGMPLSKRFTILGPVSLIAGAVILWDEYRLEVNGLLFGIPAVLLAGIAKALWQFDEMQNDLRDHKPGPNFAFQFIVWAATLTTAIWAVFLEDPLEAHRLIDFPYIRPRLGARPYLHRHASYSQTYPSL